MPRNANASGKNSQSNDIVEGSAPKGFLGTGLTLHTYSDSTYYAHIAKVALLILVILGIVIFVILGFFFPQCNATQDRGFYSCSCKPGSALDRTTGQCLCLDTGSTPATSGCSAYVNNERRYVYADVRPSADDDTGGWTESSSEVCN